MLDFEGNSWAVWNGTSFATPKVVAGIANGLASGGRGTGEGLGGARVR